MAAYDDGSDGSFSDPDVDVAPPLPPPPAGRHRGSDDEDDDDVTAPPIPSEEEFLTQVAEHRKRASLARPSVGASQVAELEAWNREFGSFQM